MTFVSLLDLVTVRSDDVVYVRYDESTETMDIYMIGDRGPVPDLSIGNVSLQAFRDRVLTKFVCLHDFIMLVNFDAVIAKRFVQSVKKDCKLTIVFKPDGGIKRRLMLTPKNKVSADNVFTSLSNVLK